MVTPYAATSGVGAASLESLAFEIKAKILSNFVSPEHGSFVSVVGDLVATSITQILPLARVSKTLRNDVLEFMRRNEQAVLFLHCGGRPVMARTRVPAFHMRLFKQLNLDVRHFRNLRAPLDTSELPNLKKMVIVWPTTKIPASGPGAIPFWFLRWCEKSSTWGVCRFFSDSYAANDFPWLFDIIGNESRGYIISHIVVAQLVWADGSRDWQDGRISCLVEMEEAVKKGANSERMFGYKARVLTEVELSEELGIRESGARLLLEDPWY